MCQLQNNADCYLLLLYSQPNSDDSREGERERVDDSDSSLKNLVPTKQSEISVKNRKEFACKEIPPLMR